MIIKINQNETQSTSKKKEASNIKKYATKEELSNLNYEKLAGYKPTQCIYGQMTGNCFSDRAVELIKKCTKRVYDWNIKDEPFPLTNKLVSGGVYREYQSPIELWLHINKRTTLHHSKQVEDLIAYLKDESTCLNVKLTKNGFFNKFFIPPP